MEPLFRCVIPTRCRVKKNSQKVVSVRTSAGYTKRKVNTPQYMRWRAEALPAIIRARGVAFDAIDFPVNIAFKFYFKDHQNEPDLSALIEGPQDELQTCGILTNDKLVYGYDGSRKIFGDKNERTVIEIYRLEI